MFKQLSLIFPAAILALCVASCADTCNDNRNSLPLAGFYLSGADSVKHTISGLEVVGVGQNGDSLLSASDVSKEDLYLPFRIDADETQYVFVKRIGEEEEITDTVSFLYTRTPKFTSAACGVYYLFGIREIKSQGVLIDSVVCPKGYIDNVNVENLRIYFNDDILDVQ